MPLTYGWRKSAAITAAWYLDSAFDGDDGTRAARIPAEAIDAWLHGGLAAEHLRPYAKPGTTPDRIIYRQLTSDEAAYCDGLRDEGGGGLPGAMRACIAAFRLAVSFPDAPDHDDQDGRKVSRVGSVGPFRGLHEDFTAGLLSSPRNAALVRQFGQLVYLASRPSEAEKKVSSQPFTPAESSAPTVLPSTSSSGPAAVSAATTSTMTDTAATTAAPI